MSENLVHTVCTDGFEMEYAQFGNGPKPLVVIPGLAIKSVMKSADALQVPYKVFTEKYTLYFFDRKKNIQPGYSLKDMARDQALALKAMGLSGVNLFGVSQGGMIAQIIAIQYPELVSKLVLSSSTSKAVPSQIELIGNWARLARAHDGEGLVSAFIDDCFSKPFADRYRRAIQAMYRDVTDAEMDRFALCADLCDTVNTIDELYKIKCPTLVLGAGDDKVVTAQASLIIADKLKAAGTPCELEMYEGRGHAVFDELKEYKDRIFEFLEK